MSWADERRAIETLFGTAWGTTTPVQYDNVEFRQPTTAWARFTILDGQGQQISLGSTAYHRWAGVVVVSIFVPAQTGTATARGYADTAAEALRRVVTSYGSSGTIEFGTPYMERVGGETETDWFQINVTCPFRRTRQHTD